MIFDTLKTIPCDCPEKIVTDCAINTLGGDIERVLALVRQKINPYFPDQKISSESELDFILLNYYPDSFPRFGFATTAHRDSEFTEVLAWKHIKSDEVNWRAPGNIHDILPDESYIAKVKLCNAPDWADFEAFDVYEIVKWYDGRLWTYPDEQPLFFEDEKDTSAIKYMESCDELHLPYKIILGWAPISDI